MDLRDATTTEGAAMLAFRRHRLAVDLRAVGATSEPDEAQLWVSVLDVSGCEKAALILSELKAAKRTGNASAEAAAQTDLAYLILEAARA